MEKAQQAQWDGCSSGDYGNDCCDCDVVLQDNGAILQWLILWWEWSYMVRDGRILEDGGHAVRGLGQRTGRRC